MSPTLSFIRETMVHMARGSYMWINVKTFRIESAGSDEELLRALLAAPQYRDHYMGDNTEPHELHGKFRLDAISVESFEPIEAGVAEKQIQAWAETNDALSEAVRESVDRNVLALLKASSVFRLRDLDPSAQHDCGWVVGTRGFHEFVAIDAAAERMFLIVASDD